MTGETGSPLASVVVVTMVAVTAMVVATVTPVPLAVVVP